MHITRAAIALLAAASALVHPAVSQGQDDLLTAPTGLGSSDEPVAVAVQASTTTAAPGDRFVLAVIFDHAEGWHTQPHESGETPSLEGFVSIPTTIALPHPAPVGIMFGPIQWPETHRVEVGFLGDEPVEIDVFDGRAIAYVPIVLDADAPLGPLVFTIQAGYQACDDQTCIRPETVELAVALTVVDPADRPAPSVMGGELFGGFDQAVFALLSDWPDAPKLAIAPTESAGDAVPAAETVAADEGEAAALGAWEIGLWLVFAIVALAMIWMVVRTFAITNKAAWRALTIIFALITILSAFLVVRAFTYHDDDWKPYTHAAFEEASAAGRIVVIDFTADWCVNCKVIEATTLRDSRVVEALSAPNVTALRADLTSEQAIGWEKLEELGPGGIPRVAIYHPGREPIQWKSFFTKDVFLAAMSGEIDLPDDGGGASIDFFGWTFTIPAGAWWLILLVAAVAGFLLNFTPCVLPVIPIKVLSLHQQAGNPRRCLALGVTFGVGIIAFFLAVAIPIVVVRSGTAPVLDWGEIFGYWWLNAILALVILAMALGMIGLFTIKLPQKAYMFNPSHDTHAGSLMTGFLTGLLSTPCTGPMLGATIAWVVTQPVAMGLSTFGAMGFGMALPYVLLAANPKWVDHLPRTGPGSELVKQVMSLLLIAVAVYFGTLAGSTLGW
ncbi:MAG: thioredoxin family protein [Phycisphaerales bacterium]|nr:thioredoxin family protein [Phycisphaerales bacterium]